MPWPGKKNDARGRTVYDPIVIRKRIDKYSELVESKVEGKLQNILA